MSRDIAAGPLAAADLIGAWRLRTWVSEDEGGVRYPMGELAEGILVYTADGTMITTIGRAGGPPTDGALGAGPADRSLDSLTTFIAYSGTFRVDGADVVHEVAMSLFTGWIGTTQRRHVALSADGRELTLSADPFVVGGRLSAQRLTWDRIGADGGTRRPASSRRAARGGRQSDFPRTAARTTDGGRTDAGDGGPTVAVAVTRSPPQGQDAARPPPRHRPGRRAWPMSGG